MDVKYICCIYWSPESYPEIFGFPFLWFCGEQVGQTPDRVLQHTTPMHNIAQHFTMHNWEQHRTHKHTTPMHNYTPRHYECCYNTHQRTTDCMEYITNYAAFVESCTLQCSISVSVVFVSFNYNAWVVLRCWSCLSPWSECFPCLVFSTVLYVTSYQPEVSNSNPNPSHF